MTESLPSLPLMLRTRVTCNATMLPHMPNWNYSTSWLLPQRWISLLVYSYKVLASSCAWWVSEMGLPKTATINIHNHNFATTPTGNTILTWTDLLPSFCRFLLVVCCDLVHGWCGEGTGGKGCGLTRWPCDDVSPMWPVFLIQLTRELESHSRDEKVGDCLPEGLCCRIQESFWTVWARFAALSSCLWTPMRKGGICHRICIG